MDIALKWLTLLHNPEDIVEIRSIDPKPVISGYFKADSAAIAKEIARFPNRTFYQTLQMVQPACYARGQHEHLMERPRETTSDNDIAGYQWILVDTDPVRPSGVSASQPEKEAARKVSATVMKKADGDGLQGADCRRQREWVSSPVQDSREYRRQADHRGFSQRSGYVVQHERGEN